MAGKTFFSEQNGTTNSQEIMNFSSSTSDLSGTLSNTNLPAPAPAPAVASYAYGLSIFLTLLILLVAFGGGVLFCVLMKRRRTKAQELESLDEAPIDEQIMTKEERIANELHLPLKKIKPQADDEIEDVAEQQTKPEKAFYIVSRVLALCVLMCELRFVVFHRFFLPPVFFSRSRFSSQTSIFAHQIHCRLVFLYFIVAWIRISMHGSQSNQRY